jgi:hypothetical protein
VRNPQLAYALAWRERTQPTREWAARYNEDFDAAMAFLDKSRRQHRHIVIALCSLALLFVISLAWSYGLVKNYDLMIEAKHKDELRHIAEEQRDDLAEKKMKQEEVLAQQNEKLIDIADDYFRGDVIIYPHPILGNIKLRRHADGSIEFFDNWAADNIIDVEVPELHEIAHPVTGPIKFNRRAAADLQAAFHEIKARGLLDRVLTWDRDFVTAGSPQIRDLISGSGGGPSPHLLGIGFDINSDFNQRNQPAAAQGQRGSVMELVPIFREFGFGWGGSKDGRHFDFVRPDISLTDGAARE